MTGSLFDGAELSYALDDGVAFPGWSLPAIDEAEAQGRYDAGERFAVLAGPPADPVATLMLDRGNTRAVVTQLDPRHQLVFSGKAELTLTGAAWAGNVDGQPTEWLVERGKAFLRVRRRPAGFAVWTDELLAVAPEPVVEAWPEFGDWSTLSRIDRDGSQWWDDGVLDPVDADGWLLDELVQADIPARWRELARKQDAPRAFSQPPEVQAKLAEPLGWRPQGRRWRKASEHNGVTVITDVSFVAGAGGGSDVTISVSRGDVEVQLGLPAATGRVEARDGGLPRSPAHPRPSASAQVGITAVLEIAGDAHELIATAVAEGAVPDGWARLSR